MPNDLKSYKGSLEAQIEKDSLTGKYTINTAIYSFDTKVKEETSEYDPASPTPDPEPDPFPSIPGIYQASHGSTYKTDTSVQDAPLTLDPGGLTCAFTNCVSLISVDLTTDVLVGASFNTHHDAFAGCRSLTTVNLGTLFETASEASTFENMFKGCTNLQTITGTIDISKANGGIGALKDMFAGCTSLASVTLKAGDIDLTEENVTVDETTYAYAYEVLGLTAEQFANAVTLVSE